MPKTDRFLLLVLCLAALPALAQVTQSTLGNSYPIPETGSAPRPTPAACVRVYFDDLQEYGWTVHALQHCDAPPWCAISISIKFNSGSYLNPIVWQGIVPAGSTTILQNMRGNFDDEVKQLVTYESDAFFCTPQDSASPRQ
jgi:hypothetical protein